VAARAHETLTTLAAELQLEIIVVARHIRDLAESIIARGIEALLADHGVCPENVTLVAYGGGGPLHAAGVAGRAGIDHIVIPESASVFSALGVSSLDVSHIYPLLLGDNGHALALGELLQTARRDMSSEGFSPDEVTATLELIDPSRSGRALWRHDLGVLPGDDFELTSVLARPTETFSAGYLLVLTAIAITPHSQVDARHSTEIGSATVPVDWGAGVRASAMLSSSSVTTASPVAGPGLVSAFATTVAVPPGWQLRRASGSTLILEQP
jgi:N-methylhydantoinase A/oxoprolinase/acetone carboxylase beta subunit